MKPVIFILTIILCIYLPVAISVSVDFNDDGFVDIQDLIIVFLSFDQEEFDTRIDTNSDGIIDIRDIVYVARRFGTAVTPDECSPQIEICDNGIDEDCDGSDLTCIAGRNLYVSTIGNDAHNGLAPTYQGGNDGPFRTVQKAITASIEGDTIFIAAGTYDLEKYSATLNKAISLVGQSRDATILTNGGTLSLHKRVNAKNIMFKNYFKRDYNSAVFRLIPSAGEAIDSMVIDSCAFDNVPGVLLSRGVEGTMRDIFVTNNVMTNINSPWSVQAIALFDGNIANIIVSNNTIRNVFTTAPYYDVIVIIFGRDEATVVDKIIVSENVIETVRGGTQKTDSGYSPGGRGVLGYGDNIKVLNNRISDFDQNGFPRNCIYLKGSNATISGNIVHNCGSETAGSGSGDICIKGNNNENNIVTGNHITSDSNQVLGGFGIYTKGGGTIEDNYIYKPHGIGIFSFNSTGLTLLISKNYVETGNRSIWSYGSGILGTIRDNALISHIDEPTRIPANFNLINNQVCKGSSCSLEPPVKTCINQGYYCCSSCSGTSYSSYDSTCQYDKAKCCAACS